MHDLAALLRRVWVVRIVWAFVSKLLTDDNHLSPKRASIFHEVRIEDVVELVAVVKSQRIQRRLHVVWPKQADLAIGAHVE